MKQYMQLICKHAAGHNTIPTCCLDFQCCNRETELQTKSYLAELFYCWQRSVMFQVLVLGEAFVFQLQSLLLLGFLTESWRHCYQHMK